MRRALVLVFLTACAGNAGSAPAWPKQHDTEADGGESLAPHTATAVATLEADPDDDVKPAPAAAVVTPAAGTTEGSGSAAATATPADEVINTEEIIIEIDD